MSRQIKLILFFSLLFGAWIFSLCFNNEIEKEIRENRFHTIALVYEIRRGAKNVSILYKYRYNNKIYWGSKPVNEVDRHKVLNKYFEIDISTKNPDKSRIYLNNEVYSKWVIDSLDLGHSSN